MLACIPTRGDAGLDDVVYNHFGSAPYFTMYDTATDKVSVLENRNAHHSHGTCHPMNQLSHYHPDCIVCSGMGRRAIEALGAEGVTVYSCDGGRVGDVVLALKAGKLSPIDPAGACRGLGQHHGPDFEHLPGRGAGFGQGGGCGHGGSGGRRR